ncbi:MAG: tyrosine-protein phosphatase [Planctomycetota bacterium]|jgi:hypothetical protein|nr:tyrosine-protein phosphatase [Planctomycetota bacterium]
MAGKRKIDLDGACSFRDLGGYPAADGRTPVWNTLFRSDDFRDELTGK